MISNMIGQGPEVNQIGFSVVIRDFNYKMESNYFLRVTPAEGAARVPEERLRS